MLQRQILVTLLVATGLVEAALLRGHNGPTSSIIERGSLIARQNRGGQGQGRGGQNNGNNGGNGGQQNNNGGQQNNNGGQNNNNGGGACLTQNSRQAASNTDGQETGTEGIKAGQAKSLTDGNNFINFCSGKTITDGKQQKGGSCNPTPMGQLPAQNKMVTTIITNPKPGDKLPAGQTFKIDVQTKNLQAGSFTNPTTTYYTAPQQLNGQGEIIGHAHVTVQEIGSLTPNNPPNAAQFAFFKGIDDAGNGQGLLSASVDGGLPAGVYRVCTIMSASNHQNVAMPIAQRGAQDDCTKFEVTNGGGGGGGGGNNNGQNNNGQNRNQGNQGQNRQGGQQGRGGRKA